MERSLRFGTTLCPRRIKDIQQSLMNLLLHPHSRRLCAEMPQPTDTAVLEEAGKDEKSKAQKRKSKKKGNKGKGKKHR